MNSPEKPIQWLLDDHELIDRVFEHIDAKTTDLGDTVWREPVDNYRGADRFDREMELFARIPTVLCPSAALPDKGSYVVWRVCHCSRFAVTMVLFEPFTTPAAIAA